MHKHILFPIDLNHPESWEKALPDVIRLAGQGGTVHVLAIVHDIGSSMVASYLPSGYEKQVMERAKAAVGEFIATHIPPEVQAQAHVGHGHVADVILKRAKKVEADLIVMASHKPDELRNLMISSHANAVVRHSRVSVLVVR